jgi:hypothetical protein
VVECECRIREERDMFENWSFDSRSFGATKYHSHSPLAAREMSREGSDTGKVWPMIHVLVALLSPKPSEMQSTSLKLNLFALKWVRVGGFFLHGGVPTGSLPRGLDHTS